MAGYPQDTVKVVFGGVIGADIWRTGFDVDVALSGTALTSSNLNAICAQILTPLNAWWTVIKGYNANGVDMSMLSAYFYPLFSTKAAAVGTAGVSSVAGTNTTGIMPFRTAVSVQKITNFAGRHNRGRMFVPFTSYTALVSTTGQMTSGQATAFATTTATLLTSVNALNMTANGVSSQKIVVTSPTASLSGLGVTQVAVNTVPDSQRRRTNKDVPTFKQVSNV